MNSKLLNENPIKGEINKDPPQSGRKWTQSTQKSLRQREGSWKGKCPSQETEVIHINDSIILKSLKIKAKNTENRW